MDDIDRQSVLIIWPFHQVSLMLYYSIAAVVPFSGLRRFPQGRGFKQWTGDDSKVLMKVRQSFSCCFFFIFCDEGLKVYIAAIEGYCMSRMILCALSVRS